ncbi:LOW QUALITY PROTEIN: hypothetical protein PHMEG_00036334 [Phytophthora megakarya]|uniref:M96 mating-specific protein n=1 Tax=Phytophthora megakarya TaxID=4795 RepID=A0A225UM92_9STRA|nr:LOW QUALITY PROTEIN: hypothetical protein PHMEG_00036334 [Phytophthora megakarya]
MTEEEQVDDVIVSFLARYNVPNTPTTSHAKHTAIVPSMYLTNDQLLSETETLLLSLNSSPVNGQEREQFTPDTLENDEFPSSGPFKTHRNVLSADEQRKVQSDLATQRRLKYRQKLKNEKESLQEQEIELSGELSRLQKVKMNEKIRQVSDISLSGWKAIAKRQKDKRIEAERIQRQLRAAVIDRSRMIHQMRALMQEPKILVNPTLCTGVPDGSDGTDLFKRFAGELDALYSQTDKVMQEANFKMASNMQYKPERTRQQSIECFVSADKAIVPFGFEEVRRAISLLMMGQPHTDVAREPTFRETTTMKYELKCQVEPGEFSQLQVYCVTRKYEEPGRVVFVWRGLIEGQGDLSGYHTDETGWLSVRPEDPTLGKLCKSTITEGYARFLPFNIGGIPNSKVTRDQFASISRKPRKK